MKSWAPLNSTACGWMNEGVNTINGPTASSGPALVLWDGGGRAGGRGGNQMPQHLTCYTIKEIIDESDLGV